MLLTLLKNFFLHIHPFSVTVELQMCPTLCVQSVRKVPARNNVSPYSVPKKVHRAS